MGKKIVLGCGLFCFLLIAGGCQTERGQDALEDDNSTLALTENESVSERDENPPVNDDDTAVLADDDGDFFPSVENPLWLVTYDPHLFEEKLVHTIDEWINEAEAEEQFWGLKVNGIQFEGSFKDEHEWELKGETESEEQIHLQSREEGVILEAEDTEEVLLSEAEFQFWQPTLHANYLLQLVEEQLYEEVHLEQTQSSLQIELWASGSVFESDFQQYLEEHFADDTQSSFPVNDYTARYVIDLYEEADKWHLAKFSVTLLKDNEIMETLKFQFDEQKVE